MLGIWCIKKEISQKETFNSGSLGTESPMGGPTYVPFPSDQKNWSTKKIPVAHESMESKPDSQLCRVRRMHAWLNCRCWMQDLVVNLFPRRVAMCKYGWQVRKLRTALKFTPHFFKLTLYGITSMHVGSWLHPNARRSHTNNWWLSLSRRPTVIGLRPLSKLHDKKSPKVVDNLSDLRPLSKLHGNKVSQSWKPTVVGFHPQSFIHVEKYAYGTGSLVLGLHPRSLVHGYRILNPKLHGNFLLLLQFL